MKKNLFYLLLLILAITMPLYIDGYLLHVFVTIFIFMTMALSWDMMLRTGQLSFGNAGFFGLGGYASLVSVAHFEINPLTSLLVAIIFAGLIAFLVGLPVLKLRGIYFAIVTLALAHVFEVVAMNLEITGGSTGMVLPEAIFGGDMQLLYWLILGVALFTIAISEIFSRSRIHYAIHSIRNDELAAKASGINVSRYLIFVFVITSALQGLAGGVYVQQYAFVMPESTFHLDYLLLPIAMALVGGTLSTAGPVIGAIFLGLVSEYLKLVMPYGHLLIYGLVIALIILFLPGGIYEPIRKNVIDRFLGGASS